MRYFWPAVSGIVLLLLIVVLVEFSSSDSVSGDQIANTAYFGIICLVAASGVLGSGIRFTHLIRNLFIWLAIIFALMTGYNNRYELQDMAHWLTAGMIPASLISSHQNDKPTVTLSQTMNDHFETKALVNNQPVHFMIDTSASSVILSSADAQRIGIDTRKLNYFIPVNTANGETRAAPVVLDSLQIGNIARKNIYALVTRTDTTNTNLIGMSFLNRLSGHTVHGDQLILSD